MLALQSNTQLQQQLLLLRFVFHDYNNVPADHLQKTDYSCSRNAMVPADSAVTMTTLVKYVR